MRKKAHKYFLQVNKFLHEQGKATKTMHSKIEIIQILVHLLINMKLL